VKDWNDLLLAHGADSLREELSRVVDDILAPERLAAGLYDLLMEATHHFGRTLPPGAITWAAAERRDLIAVVDALDTRINAAYDAANAPAFRAAVAEWCDVLAQIGTAFAVHTDTLATGRRLGKKLP
jgi:hypothetical protein